MARISARHVVRATVSFQRPMIRTDSRAISSSVYQTDAIHYRNPADLPPGAVLVVGAGNSGCQIADELLRGGRRVFFAISRHSRAPRRYRGKDIIGGTKLWAASMSPSTLFRAEDIRRRSS